MHFGDWVVQNPISKRAFSIVYMVINIRTGQPATARQISKSRRNEAAVEQELEMTRRISGLSNVSSQFPACHFCASNDES
jgi:hypothetical protein